MSFNHTAEKPVSFWPECSAKQLSHGHNLLSKTANSYTLLRSDRRPKRKTGGDDGRGSVLRGLLFYVSLQRGGREASNYFKPAYELNNVTLR